MEVEWRYNWPGCRHTLKTKVIGSSDLPNHSTVTGIYLCLVMWCVKDKNDLIDISSDEFLKMFAWILLSYSHLFFDYQLMGLLLSSL